MNSAQRSVQAVTHYKDPQVWTVKTKENDFSPDKPLDLLQFYLSVEPSEHLILLIALVLIFAKYFAQAL